MAFGAEVIFAAGLGFVVLGPKRMHALLAQVARAKAELQKAHRNFKDDLEGALATPAADEEAESVSGSQPSPAEPAPS